MGGEARRLAREVSHLSMGSDTTPPGGNSSSNLMNLGATIDSPYMSKLESVASSAVKAADKVGASLIIVFTNTGMAIPPAQLKWVYADSTSPRNLLFLQ